MGHSDNEVVQIESLEEEKEIREFYQNQVATLTETLQKTEQELYDATYNNRSSEWESLVVQNQKTTSELAKTQEEVRNHSFLVLIFPSVEFSELRIVSLNSS